MKNFILALLILTQVESVKAQKNEPTFNSHTCRKFDYYQLAGDRKVFEVAIVKQTEDFYKLEVSDLYEVLQPNGSYKVRDKANVINPVTDMLCSQAGAGLDQKVITCRKDLTQGFDYVSIRRIESTSIMSRMASEPGKIITYSSYEIELLPALQKGETYRQFNLEDCVLE